MNRKSLIVLASFCILLSSCSVLEREEEVYESKSREVKSVFDDINVPNKEERERVAIEDEKLEEEETSSIKQDYPTDNQTTDDQVEEDRQRSTTTDLNLRSQMKLNNKNVLMTIPEGRSVELLEDNLGNDQTWSRILYDGQEGYVKSEYLLER